jgi:hypothetical protein
VKRGLDMKVIDLLNKIANGEEVPKKIRINGWCYKFEWQDYAGNYLDESEEIDLMSALSCDKEELNKEVEILDDEEKKIPEKLNISNFPKHNNSLKKTAIKINEIIDYLEKQRKEE